MPTKKRKTTTNAIEILHDRFITGRPEMQGKLEQAREILRVSMQLLELREEVGLTQEELAELAGTSRSVIARLESPDYEQHTMTTLRKVADAMGHTVKVVFEPHGTLKPRFTLKARNKATVKKKSKQTVQKVAAKKSVALPKPSKKK